MAKMLFMNPRKRRRRKARKARARRRAAAVRTNPTRRKRRYSESKVMAKKRRRRIHRNPISSNLVKQIISGQVVPAATGAAGGLVLDVAMGQIQPRLPEALRKPSLAIAVKGVVALGLGYLAEKSGAVNRTLARDATRGALTVVMYQAGRQTLAKLAPKLALAGLAEQFEPDLAALVHSEGDGIELGEQFNTDVLLGEQFDTAPMLNGLDVDHYRRGPGY